MPFGNQESYLGVPGNDISRAPLRILGP